MKYRKLLSAILLCTTLAAVAYAQATSNTTQLQYNDPDEQPKHQFQYPGNPFGNGK
jgi:TRAP-type C4-dicarboxylate transport system substrate-binding protein